jgi:hypothetical protein
MEIVYGLLLFVVIIVAAGLIVPFIEPSVMAALGPWLRYCDRVDRWASNRRHAKRVDVTTFGDTERKYKTTL